MCNTYNPEQVVDKPTRGNKTLDLFFTTNSSLISSVEVKPAMGDHGCVEVQTLVSPRLARPTKRKIFLYSKGNFHDMKRDLLEFSTVYLSNFHERSLHENWDVLKNKLSTLMEKYILAKMSSGRHNLPWFTSNLKRLNRKVQRLYNVQKRLGLECDKRKFRQTRKAYKQKLNKVYGDYSPRKKNNQRNFGNLLNPKGKIMWASVCCVMRIILQYLIAKARQIS